MSSLKIIRNRIKSVRSTKKITSAMKMIAATKLRKAEEWVLTSRPYADMMNQMIHDLLSRAPLFETPLPLLSSNREDKTVLVMVVTSDRGLCGGFNTNVVRTAQHFIQDIENQG